MKEVEAVADLVLRIDRVGELRARRVKFVEIHIADVAIHTGGEIPQHEVRARK